MRMMRILFSLVIVALFLLCISWAAQEENGDPVAAPTFALTNFQNDEIVSSSKFKGSPVVINFWFAGCPPCRWEAPSLKRFSEENPDIVVLSITEPKANADGAIEEFIDEFGLEFPVLLDATGAVTRAFDEGMEYPTTFLINAEGKLVGKIVNYIEWDSIEMRDVVKHLRNGKLLWYYRYLSRMK